MKNIFSTVLLSVALCACGGQSPRSEDLDTTKIERPDSESIVSMAAVMAEDLSRFLREDDIQSAAALCEEGLDNLMYFRDSGDDVSADIYAKELHIFVKKHYEEMEDMATQNYLVKQFMAAVGDSAILSARRRRFPQEEEIRREPTIEADEPAPTRPAVRHLRQKESQELNTEGDDYTTDKRINEARKAEAAAKRQQNKPAQTGAAAGKRTAVTPQTGRTPAPSRAAAQGGQAKGGTARQQSGANGQRKTVQGNNGKKKGRDPIIIECKKKTTNKSGAANGGGTSSQWYLVRPLD